MSTLTRTLERRDVWRLAAIGTVAGVFSGLFGVGGGTVIVPLLILWFGYGERLATGTSLVAIVPIGVLGALAQEQMITVSDGRAEVSDLTLPPTLRLTILRRISFLPDDTLRALRFASILGSGFTLTDLAVVTGRSAVDLSMSLAEPIRARVLEDDGAPRAPSSRPR